MLKQKSRELTWKILARLKIKETTSAFSEINPSILNCLEIVYIQARLDATHKVKYELLDDFSVFFPDN